MTGRLDRIEKILAVLPVVQANQGILVSDLSRITGISAKEIVSDLPSVVNLSGVPPYAPDDLVDLEIEGDRVTIRFADQFRRPVRLTLREALALDMALAGWEEETESPFSRAVASIREKVRAAVAPDVAEEVSEAAQRISAPHVPGRAADRVAQMKEALGRQLEVEVVYFSRSHGRLSVRTIRPYGIFERVGHFYVVAHSDPPGRVVTLRADRIRDVRFGTEEYEIPDDFDVASFRDEESSGPSGEEMTARIRFLGGSGRFARELFPAKSFEALPGGDLVAIVRTRAMFWLVSELLRWGESAVVEEPEELRRELLRIAGETRARYREKGRKAKGRKG